MGPRFQRFFTCLSEFSNVPEKCSPKKCCYFGSGNKGVRSETPIAIPLHYPKLSTFLYIFESPMVILCVPEIRHMGKSEVLS